MARTVLALILLFLTTTDGLAASSLVTSKGQIVTDDTLGSGVYDSASMLQLGANPTISAQKAMHKIPEQLILTGKWNSMEELPGPVARNVHKTLALNPGLRVRWLGDKACQEYLMQNFDKDLLAIFDGELRGSFRGDICRAAVLWREGGFYTDLDVEWKAPMRELVDDTTTFMSVYGEGTDMLNAVMAAEPRSKILESTLLELRKWYSSPREDHTQWMGPATLRKAMRDSCPKLDLDAHTLEKACGPNKIRLYEQRQLHCNQGSAESPIACPPSRVASKFEGLEFGLFEPGQGGKLIGWPRFADCASWGCGAEGWTESRPKV